MVANLIKVTGSFFYSTYFFVSETIVKYGQKANESGTMILTNKK